MPFEVDQAPRQSFAVRELLDGAPRIADALDAGITVTIRPITWLGVAGRIDRTEGVDVDVPEPTKRALMEAFNDLR
jgi:hypothetical protein